LVAEESYCVIGPIVKLVEPSFEFLSLIDLVYVDEEDVFNFLSQIKIGDEPRRAVPVAAPMEVKRPVPAGKPIGVVWIIGKFDEIAIGVKLVGQIEKIPVLWRPIIEVIADGDEDLRGKLFRFADARVQKSKIVRAEIDDCCD